MKSTQIISMLFFIGLIFLSAEVVSAQSNRVAAIESSQIPSSNLKLWLKADGGVIVGANNKVSRWNDQSGNKNHALQSDLALQPTVIPNQLNGRSVLRFSCSTQSSFNRLDIINFDQSKTDKIDIFVVYKINEDPTNIASIILESSPNFTDSETGWVISDNDNSCRGCLDGIAASVKGNVGFCVANSYPTQNNYKLVNATFDKALSTDEAKIRYNKKLLNFTNSNYNKDNANLFGNNTLFIGQRGNLNPNVRLGLDGDIAEIIVYNNVLDDNSRKIVENYLYDKWNLKSDLKLTNIQCTSEQNPPNTIGFDDKGQIVVNYENYGEGIAENVSCNLVLLSGYDKGITIENPNQVINLIGKREKKTALFKFKTKLGIQSDSIKYKIVMLINGVQQEQFGSFPTKTYQKIALTTINQTSAEENYDMAVKNYKESNDEVALTFINKALSIDKYNAKYNALKGRIFYFLKQFENGIAFCDKAIEIDPSYAYSYYTKGACYRELRKPSTALTSLNEAIKKANKEEDLIDFKIERACALIDLTQFNTAIDEYNKILTQYSQNTNALYYRAFAHGSNGSYDLGIADCETILRIDPANQEAKELIQRIRDVKQNNGTRTNVQSGVANFFLDLIFGGGGNSGGDSNCRCSNCGGTGKIDGPLDDRSASTCPSCGGSGKCRN